MSQDSYVVITPSEDGARVEQMSGTELRKKLNEGWWGDKDWADKVPDNNDPNYWRNQAVIVKGVIVVPKAVQTVTEYQL